MYLNDLLTRLLSRNNTLFTLFSGGGRCSNGAIDTSNDNTDEKDDNPAQTSHQTNKQDENDMLDWRIYPTSVKADSKDPLETVNNNKNAEIISSQQFLSRAERENENSGPVSRDQLYRDLLKERRREIHVEDFLWTGSGDYYRIRISK